ncbi:MAG: lamin tail domain-containing protein [Bacteroidota bacterium]
MKKTLLSLSLMTLALFVKAQNCSELFISEYVEGGGNNKALEFYNPTSNSINMSNYRLVRYSNGSPIGADSTDLSGNVAAYSTFVIVNGQTTGTGSSPACSPVLQALAQQLDHAYPAPTYVNGDDAMVLARINPYKILDIFGEIGVQPATAWSDAFPYNGTAGKWWTKDLSLQRKATVQIGLMTNPSPFNVTLEWDSLPKDNWTDVGVHDCDCKPVGVKENSNQISLRVFPNPSNGNEMAFVSDKSIKEIEITNAIGQVVFRRTIKSVEKTIILKDMELSTGIYYATVKSDAGSKSEKIIIK